MRRRHRFGVAHVAAALAAFLGSSCGADYWAFESIQNGPNPHTTVVVVWLSDSPVDGAESLWTTIDRVELLGTGPDMTLSSGPAGHDLLALTNGRREEVGRGEVEPGRATALRLTFSSRSPADHRIRVSGVDHTLRFADPSDAVLDLQIDVLLEPGESVSLLVDLDARLSVAEAGGNYAFVPRGTALDEERAGHVEGTVLGSDGRPIAGATVSAQQDGEESASTRTRADGGFVLGPLSPGAYVVVASAPNRGTDVAGPVEVARGGQPPAVALRLAPSVPGRIAGSVVGARPGLVVRAYGDEGFLGLAGVDPITGSFLLPALPAGPYRLELWEGGMRRPEGAVAQVVSGGSTHVVVGG